MKYFTFDMYVPIHLVVNIKFSISILSKIFLSWTENFNSIIIKFEIKFSSNAV